MQRHPNSRPSPAVRVHQASPTPTPTTGPSQDMLAHSPFVGGVWHDNYNQGPYLNVLPRSAFPKAIQDARIHKRTSSGSSIASAGPPSPLDQTNMYPRIATSDANYSPSRFDFEYTPQTAKTTQSLPEAILFPTPTGFGPVETNMRRIQSQGQDERAAQRGPRSASTMSHNSPATPQNFDPDFPDDRLYKGQFSMAYQQSLQDVFPPPDQTVSQMPSYAMNNRLVSRPSMVQERLQAAQQDRLHSPTSNPRGDRSPFRQSAYEMPAPQQLVHPIPTLARERTSVSPKELILGEHDVDDGQQSLFPETSAFAHRRAQSHLSTFYTPSYSAENSMAVPQSYPFVSPTGRPDAHALTDAEPAFPASMLSMESTNEEGVSEPPSSQASSHPEGMKPEQTSIPPRPVDTSSGAGTYSCTYHGCCLRFESPAKLQKHKREGHRQHETGHSVSPSLALRNSQAGPHRCDRVNPSTGKSCNSIFSRPYDLTRHEDTIHNGQKQKVRCHLCTEEKTFSRNDALTRHMRVVHPDVDWVGKQKRKSHR